MAGWSPDARYDDLIRAHGASLVRLATLLVGNAHDAEDVVQEVLIAAARSWPFDRPLAYLRRAVANRSVSLLRSRRDISSEALPEGAYEDPGLIRSDDAAQFYWMVRALPQRQRVAVVLRYHAGLDDPAIARILGISRGTVRSQVHHALATLRAQLGDREAVTTKERS